jgi:hypothetical protein
MKTDTLRQAMVVAAAMGALVALAAGQPCAAQPLDLLALRDASGPTVCLVTAENALGLPVAYASGFLLGEGRFIVTDLASLTQPGVKQATLRFRDGTTAVARQFGLADPAIGLAVIRVEKDVADKPGLTLSATSVGEGGSDAAVVGWRWAEELDVTGGRITNGVKAAALATRLKIAAPAGDLTFLEFDGGHVDAAPGSPILDRSADVVGVLLKVPGANRPLVVPAGVLRGALLSAELRLKPLAELPKAVWPVAVQMIPGKPPTPQEFAQAVRAIRDRSRCTRCNGRGSIFVSRVTGTARIGAISQSVTQTFPEPCLTCKGEGLVFKDGLYGMFKKMIEGAMRLDGSDADAKAKEAAFNNVMELLKSLHKVGPTYRSALSAQAKADLVKTDLPYPRGALLYARVSGWVEGPDGRFTLLELEGGKEVLAARADSFQAIGDGKSPNGHWINLAGLIGGPVDLGEQHPIFIRPFGWAQAPSPEPVKPAPEPDERPPVIPPPSTPNPPKTPRGTGGEPNFFGI